MKKILLTLMFALVSMYASAYFKVGDIYYQPDEQADDGTCWVRDSPYYGGYDGLTDITIPGRVTYNGREYRVTSIGSEAFKNVTTLQSVRLGWGVEEISSYAFAGCTNLKYVYLPSTLTHIYNYAFQNCSSMTEMGVAAPTPPTLSSYALSGMRTCNVLTAIQTNASSYNAVSAWKAADSNGSVSYSGVKANDFVENGLCYVITSPSTMSNNVNVTLVGIQSGVTYLPMTSSAHDYTNSTYGGGSYIFCNWTEVAPYAAYNHSTLQKIGRSLQQLPGIDRGQYLGRDDRQLCLLQLFQPGHRQPVPQGYRELWHTETGCALLCQYCCILGVHPPNVDLLW